MSTSIEASMAKWPTRVLRGHREKVHSVAWSCDGRRLASGSTDHTIRIWTPERAEYNKTSTELRGHTQSVDQVAWDPTTPERLASASSDRTLKFWDIRQGKPTHSVQLTGANINLTWTPDGKTVAVGDKADLISFIDTSTHEVIKTHREGTEVNEIVFSTNSDLFFLTAGDGTVKIYNWPSLTPYHTLFAHPANCFCLDLDPRGRYLAIGSNDAVTSLWDVQEWMCLRTFSKLEYPIRGLSFSYDGEFLATASEDLFIDIASTSTGQTVHTIPTTAATNSVAWHPARHFLAYAGDDEPTGRGILRVFGV